ncbi:putative methyltransferase-domain-containing protein [Apodospora peruviana]|uniref:Methyltransferase-domain-containing protein n=1 Tax=Apodospora peruviana TaxID=516989 RepID=A0AAE0ILU5_9PEZI|nr:putative methyltransferase-domain-containing protein [Apodospora peruviana]
MLVGLPGGCPLPPSSSLPLARQLDGLGETEIVAAIDNLLAIYCTPAAAVQNKSSVLLEVSCERKASTTRLVPPPVTDSGYNSGYTSDDDCDDAAEEEDGVALADTHTDTIALLRADEFERAFATKWLERFISRAADEEDMQLACFSSDETRQIIVERAADLLTVLLSPPEEQQQQQDDKEGESEDDSLCREFEFSLSDDGAQSVCIQLNDRIAGCNSSDHTDVGLQTWGASIVFCQMFCEDPSRFNMASSSPQRIVELGSGTGLVSLVLGKLLQRPSAVVATDYHAAVIENLRRNIAVNFPETSGLSSCPVQACHLDWAEKQPGPNWPLGDSKANVLFATDVVYALEHAMLLYDCASRLLAPDGVFWLLQTVRENGRFASIADTVEAVFPTCEGEECPGKTGTRVLKILSTERTEKRKGIGRGDESFYNLFRIGWA